MFIRIYAAIDRRFQQSFEGFVEAVQHWQGMFIELDGSFVWVQRSENRSTQVDGMAYDRDGAVEYVELKGDVDIEIWRALCKALNAGESFETIRIHCVETNKWMAGIEFARNLST